MGYATNYVAVDSVYALTYQQRYENYKYIALHKLSRRKAEMPVRMIPLTCENDEAKAAKLQLLFGLRSTEFAHLTPLSQR